MTRVPYAIFWPGGNTTALITEAQYNRKNHVHIAQEIMKHDPQIEQVGYIEPATMPGAEFRLQMMGGEFCGNATRSAAFYWGKKTGNTTISIEVSGYPNVLTAYIRNESESSVVFPGNFFVNAQSVPEGTLVDLMGIRHLIVTNNTAASTGKLLEIYKEDLPALGIIRATAKGADFLIDPVVWVRETNTAIPETGCGSGSIATAIAQYKKTKANSFRIWQPSGEAYSVQLETDDNGIQSIELGGKVEERGNDAVSVDI